MLHVDNSKEYLAVAASTGAVVVYDLRAGKAAAEWQAHQEPVGCVRFCPLSRHLASYSDAERRLRVWSLFSDADLTSSMRGFLQPRLLPAPPMNRCWEVQHMEATKEHPRDQPCVAWMTPVILRLMVPEPAPEFGLELWPHLNGEGFGYG